MTKEMALLGADSVCDWCPLFSNSFITQDLQLPESLWNKFSASAQFLRHLGHIHHSWEGWLLCLLQQHPFSHLVTPTDTWEPHYISRCLMPNAGCWPPLIRAKLRGWERILQADSQINLFPLASFCQQIFKSHSHAIFEERCWDPRRNTVSMQLCQCNYIIWDTKQLWIWFPSRQEMER